MVKKRVLYSFPILNAQPCYVLSSLEAHRESINTGIHLGRDAMSQKKTPQKNVSTFSSIVDIFFCYDDKLLIVGTADVLVPSHAERLQIAREEKKFKSDAVFAAEYFYGNVEKALKSADLAVYQLPEGFTNDGESLKEYKDADKLSTLEKLKHINDPAEISFYEFASFFYNECLHLFGRGIRLGKK